jgi:hypothetical protein
MLVCPFQVAWHQIASIQPLYPWDKSHLPQIIESAPGPRPQEFFEKQTPSSVVDAEIQKHSNASILKVDLGAANAVGALKQ